MTEPEMRLSKSAATMEEENRILRSAIERADAKLDWVLGTTPDGKRTEWALTTIHHVRRILRAALKKNEPPREPRPRAAIMDRKKPRFAPWQLGGLIDQTNTPKKR